MSGLSLPLVYMCAHACTRMCLIELAQTSCHKSLTEDLTIQKSIMDIQIVFHRMCRLFGTQNATDPIRLTLMSCTQKELDIW